MYNVQCTVLITREVTTISETYAISAAEVNFKIVQSDATMTKTTFDLFYQHIINVDGNDILYNLKYYMETIQYIFFRFFINYSDRN